MLDLVKIILPRSDISQIIDGLTERMLVWRATEEYIETGYPQSADYIEECGDAHEAQIIADHYKYLIDQISNQITQQDENKLL